MTARSRERPNHDVDCEPALVRLDHDGVIDATFGTDGVVTTDFLNAEPRARGDVGEALIVQPNGKLLGAGYAHVGPDVPTTFALARYVS
jgi:beta-propeller uncharacterized protein DUF5122